MGDPGSVPPREVPPEGWKRLQLYPQGGGDHYNNHRCAGEWITIELMKRAVRLLVEFIQYEVSEQDLRVDLPRMPTIPKSCFVTSNVTRA